MAIPSNASITCAWCSSRIREGSSRELSSYGLCLGCLGSGFRRPIENVSTLSARAANRLPFGFIRLNSEGRVLAYNTEESALSGLPRKRVLGNNFFRTIAPCTCVDEFEGQLKEMMASPRPERRQIQFLFKFLRRTTMVSIAMTTDPLARCATLMIRKLKDKSNQPAGASETPD